MRLTFLGTGGSEGYPAAWCRCGRCERARELGGRNIRRRSSLLVDDDLLCDFGPDVPAALQDLGRSLANLRTILVTHGHDDHFLPVSLKYRHPRYGATGLPELMVYGSTPTLARLSEMPVPLDEARVRGESVGVGQWVESGPYRVLSQPARHAPPLDARLYVISDGERAVLYATDTGAFPDEAWRLLEGVRLDAAVLDATFWDEPSDDDHLSLDDVEEHARELRRRGILLDGAPVFGTHFSHRSQPDQEALERRLTGMGVMPAYDGLVVEL